MTISSLETNLEPGASLLANAPNRFGKRMMMLTHLPPGGVGAEIGVWEGAFTECILAVARPQELHLIDPWDLLAGSPAADWNNARHAEAAEMRRMHDHVVEKFANRPQVVIRRGFSADILSDYPDDHFDWVYIDGNHQYEFVRDDLALSFRKVKPGGVIAGDDYHWKYKDDRPVKRAVDGFMAGAGARSKLYRIGQQFLIALVK